MRLLFSTYPIPENPNALRRAYTTFCLQPFHRRRVCFSPNTRQIHISLPSYLPSTLLDYEFRSITLPCRFFSSIWRVHLLKRLGGRVRGFTLHIAFARCTSRLSFFLAMIDSRRAAGVTYADLVFFFFVSFGTCEWAGFASLWFLRL